MAIDQVPLRAANINQLVQSYFYRSDAQFEAGSAKLQPDFRYVEAGSMSVVRFRGPSIRVRRTQHHIREKRSNSFVICLALKGNVSVTQMAAHDLHVSEGSFVIASADRPFLMTTYAGEGAECSTMNLLVPTHMVYQFFARDDHACGRSFSTASALGRIARNILNILSDEYESIGSASVAELAQTSLNALLTVARDQVSRQLDDGKSDSSQFRRVLSYIDANFSQPRLTASEVASACHISRRYLYYMFKEADMSFADYLWTKRLTQAHEWLTRSLHDNLNITEIAARSGFGSPSHFISVYQAKFGSSPRLIRLHSRSDMSLRLGSS